MPAITQAQVVKQSVDGVGEKVAHILLDNVTTADTIDVSAIGPVTFKKVKWAVWGPMGKKTTGVVGSVGGTTVTITLSGLASDSIWLMVCGSGPNA